MPFIEQIEQLHAHAVITGSKRNWNLRHRGRSGM